MLKLTIHLSYYIQESFLKSNSSDKITKIEFSRLI